MNISPSAVHTAYHLARNLSLDAIEFTRHLALTEIPWPTPREREEAREKYDLALRIAQQPVQGPYLPPGVGY